MKTSYRTGLAVIALLAAAMPATAERAAAAYEPLSFLVGHCWKGTFPKSEVTDEHCFSWVYGGRFMRDQHVVHHGNGKPDDLGESIYLWDAIARQLQYLYIESAGGYSRGTVKGTPEGLLFPTTHYREGSEEQVYRSRWQRTGTDGYDVITEFLIKGRWTPGFTLHMQQVAS